MRRFAKWSVITIVVIVGGCASAPPVPVAVDTDIPAVADSNALHARVRVLSPSEADRIFGRGAGTLLGFVELEVENRGTTSASGERKGIRMLTPERQDLYPLSPLRVALVVAPPGPMTATGNNAFDLVQLFLGLASLAQRQEIAAKWIHLMPETFTIAAGEYRRMVLAFATPQWAPGVWRLEVPFGTETGASLLSIPLAFKTSGRRSE